MASKVTLALMLMYFSLWSERYHVKINGRKSFMSSGAGSRISRENVPYAVRIQFLFPINHSIRHKSYPMSSNIPRGVDIHSLYVLSSVP